MHFSQDVDRMLNVKFDRVENSNTVGVGLKGNILQ